VAVRAHDGERVQQDTVLGCGLDVHEVEQPEQQDAVLGVDRPQQRQIVAAMPGGDGLALFRQGLGAALLGQELPGLASEVGVAVLRLLGLKHLGDIH